MVSRQVTTVRGVTVAKGVRAWRLPRTGVHEEARRACIVYPGGEQQRLHRESRALHHQQQVANRANGGQRGDEDGMVGGRRQGILVGDIALQILYATWQVVLCDRLWLECARG